MRCQAFAGIASTTTNTQQQRRIAIVGCGVGAIVTSIIQSSSATTVMLVSFVDAGLMTFVQAAGVVLGANVGTTMTAQLIAFNITAYALPCHRGQA